jgi:predicted nucleotide-binding protein
MAETTRPKLRVNEEEARQKIQVRIEKGEQLRYKEIRSEDELEKARTESKKWSDYNKTLLLGLFDNASIAEDAYTDFDDVPRMWIIGTPTPFSEKLDRYQKGMNSSIYSLESIRDRLELYDEPSANEKVSDTSPPTFGNDVFIVHGHDQAAKHTIAGFVRRLGLNPIILDEQVNRGQTIIEKFEENADEAGFAIVLLTPDDVGAPKDKQDQLKPRARQNVVLELGYFMGKLGRERVCPLLKDEVEKPSDIDGLVYVPMDNFNGWQLKLAKEMKQAGLPVDSEKLL